MADFPSTNPILSMRHITTVSLPLDIVPNILTWLDASDLESCSLVTHSFHTVSREILFSFHLVLCGDTYEAKCSFLLDKKGAHLCRRVKNLTIQLADIPGLGKFNHAMHPDLIDFVRKVGPQLDGLSLDGRVDHQSWLAWKDRTTRKYQELFYTAVLPHIRSLEIRNFSSLPLLTILSHCQHLQRVIVCAQYSAMNGQEEAALKKGLPGVSYLSITGFRKSDFELVTSLGQYINDPKSKVTFLNITGYSLRYSRLKLSLQFDFLPPMDSLRSNLQHLSLGLEIYDSIIRDYENGDHSGLLPLPTFPQLQTLSLCMRLVSVTSLDKWPLWFEWITRNLRQPSPPSSLDTLRLVVHDVDNTWMIFPQPRREIMTQFAVIPNIKIEAILKTNGRIPQRAEKASGLLKSYLNAWEDTGKLGVWLSDM
ncbi:hypothetical protein DL96DRAFT_494895 [Flagelloscypha sp. PMI_526]|nr:hypothetical protein DL96DRAFT_494895 [Flagelloscypha sp. PMI_526]